MSSGDSPQWLRRFLVAGLLLAGLVVMRPFLAAIAWAAILCFVSWPLLVRAQAVFGGRRSLAALSMTLLLTLLLGGVLLWLLVLLRGELSSAVREAAALAQTGVRLPEPVLRIPWLGSWLQERLLELGNDRDAWGRQLSELVEQLGIDAVRMVGDLAPVALVPFGAPLIWGSIGTWILLQGQVVAGIGLLLWGFLVISWIDNLVRPMVISGVAKIPFLLVLFGVLGGLAAFGLIGLFVGPVILAVLHALWREWSSANAERNVVLRS
jgi:predicted PurR-regulated permease PerM